MRLHFVSKLLFFSEVTSSVDEQDRKSVDDVFDELLTDLNTSIDKA